MFGFTQYREKRHARAEALRAERALEAARMQPLAIQQDIARRALQECVVTVVRLSALSASREQESLYLLRLAELEQRIRAAELEADAPDLPPPTITAIFAQTLLAISSGTRQGHGLESIGEKIAQWSKNLLADFERLQLSH